MAHPAPFDEYQRIHGKRVVFVALEPFSHQTRSVSFKNTIDLVDRRAIAASGGRFLVLHKDLAGEFEALHLGNLLIDADRRNTIQQVEAADEYLRTNYGEPVFDDEWFSVYDVQSSE